MDDNDNQKKTLRPERSEEKLSTSTEQWYASYCLSGVNFGYS